MNFAIIDYFFLGILFFCVIMGTIKGFVDSVFDRAAPVLSVIVAFLFYKRVSVLFTSVIEKPIIRSLAAFLTLFILAFILTKIVQSILEKFFDNKVMGGLNRTLGFMFGFAEGIAIIFLILFVISWQPFFDYAPLCENSFFYGILNTFIPNMQSSQGTNVTFVTTMLGGLHV